jgi:hypothetical protein
MRFESLVNLIGFLDPITFRDVVRRCLVARGYQPVPADGPYDSGADFLLYLRGNEPAPCAVQVSVEKNWKAKLREDARKVAALGVSTLLFASSRRMPNGQFQEIQDEIEVPLKIRLQRMDAQEIADLAQHRGFVPDLLKVAGVAPVQLAPRPFERPNFRKDMAYACAFFGSDARELRKAALDEAVFTAVVNAGGTALREVIVDQVALSMGLAASQRALVTSTIDRLLQENERRLRGKNGEVALDEKELVKRGAVRSLEQANMDSLRRDIDECLKPYIRTKSRLETVREAILEDLGALLMDIAARTSAAASSSDLPIDGVRNRLVHLEGTLATLGLDAGECRKAISELGRLASESQLGKHLIAGEMVIRLFTLQMSHLVRALEGRDELVVVLDTPVAMPLLCNLLYAPANQQYFVASQHVYDQLLTHGISMILPRYYLQEMASHLIDAYRDYSEIIDMDTDLRASTNAFVAHYVAMKQLDAASIGSFVDYLGSFGLNEGLARGDFYVTRDALMRKIEATLGRYHIRCEDLDAKGTALRLAQERIAAVQKDGEFAGRARVLLDHDASTLGWLHEREADSRIAYVLCTWDRLHFRVRKDGGVSSDVLDPVALGDILSVVVPEGHDMQFASPWVFALRFSDEDATRGDAVWDFLVGKEKGLHDAKLREVARSFKESWLLEIEKDSRSRDLQDAWERWKSEHMPQ